MILARGHNPICMACRVNENTPETSACDAMMVANVASTTIGTSAQAGRQFVERIIGCAGIGKDQGALSEIVKQ